MKQIGFTGTGTADDEGMSGDLLIAEPAGDFAPGGLAERHFEPVVCRRRKDIFFRQNFRKIYRKVDIGSDFPQAQTEFANLFGSGFHAAECAGNLKSGMFKLHDLFDGSCNHSDFGRVHRHKFDIFRYRRIFFQLFEAIHIAGNHYKNTAFCRIFDDEREIFQILF